MREERTAFRVLEQMVDYSCYPELDHLHSCIHYVLIIMNMSGASSCSLFVKESPYAVLLLFEEHLI